uniref:Non-structural protein 3b n=1 Tax=Feline coronavirus TaxID=12663 RepID=C3S0S5_9ALPC|nr:non-structural protein 3b [Feline coronavirus]ACI13512.1 non-structural protein 3b [Feline coronavirus]ACI13516.1 non-structural protein 3b [Feline coronavirus]ACI13524.1 non-structural protein 3b [Feline coronavirus]ACI13544.1 non-structural protein 3b [Feline coronavirus]
MPSFSWILRSRLIIRLFNITVYDFCAKNWYKLPFAVRLRIVDNTKPRTASTIKRRRRVVTDYRKIAILNAARK